MAEVTEAGVLGSQAIIDEFFSYMRGHEEFVARGRDDASVETGLQQIQRAVGVIGRRAATDVESLAVFEQLIVVAQRRDLEPGDQISRIGRLMLLAWKPYSNAN